jgi:hypothetical protein
MPAGWMKRRRDQVIKDWSNYAASDPARRIQPGVYLPSYVEWLTCMQMIDDARKPPANQPARTVGAGSSEHRARRRSSIPRNHCPVMHFREDGSR